MHNIEQYLVRDPENQTAFLQLPQDCPWWYWYGSEAETQAYYLKLLARTDPKGEVAPELVKYLLNNRKHATYWNSTRDTALCVEAMADFLKASGEDKPDMVVTVSVDGKKPKEVKIDASNLFSFDNAFVLTGDEVTSGDHKVEISRKGRGPVYFNAYVTYFTLEDPIKQAGLEVKVNRKLYRLRRRTARPDVPGAAGQVVSQREEKYRRDGTEGRRHPQERRPRRDRAGDRQQERLRVPGLRGHEGRRLRAGGGPQRLQRQRHGRLHGVPRPEGLLLRPHPGARQAQRPLPHACRDPRQVLRPADHRPTACTPPSFAANSDESKVNIRDAEAAVTKAAR